MSHIAKKIHSELVRVFVVSIVLLNHFDIVLENLESVSFFISVVLLCIFVLEHFKIDLNLVHLFNTLTFLGHVIHSQSSQNSQKKHQDT